MLKSVLIINAFSCAIFGALFFFKSEDMANFIGTPPALFVQILGAGLFINALLLIYTSFQSAPKRADVLFFSIGDAAWVVFTVLLLIGNIWINNSEAIYWSLAVALFVGLCGFLQWIYAPKAQEQT